MAKHLQDVAKGENVKTATKKRLKENSLAFLDDTVSGMAPRKSKKVNTSKQITISSSKPKKHKHQSRELDDTIFSKLKKERKVSFVNYPIASLFNQVDVILGGKLISSATNTYAHNSILEMLLNYDKEAAESHLGCGLFCKDTDGQMEEMEISAHPVLNTGLKTRSEWTRTSKIVEPTG